MPIPTELGGEGRSKVAYYLLTGHPPFDLRDAMEVMIAHARDPQAVVLTLAADHVILDPDLFHAACLAGRACLPPAPSPQSLVYRAIL